MSRWSKVSRNEKKVSSIEDQKANESERINIEAFHVGRKPQSMSCLLTKPIIVSKITFPSEIGQCLVPFTSLSKLANQIPS